MAHLWTFARASAMLLLLGLCWPGSAPATEPPPVSALLVGGGPDVDSNAAQIEGHVKFVASLLPPPARRVVLFAGGKTDQPTVSYADTSPAADAERALDVLLADHDAAEPVLTRPPSLGVAPDGPARLAEVRRALARLGASPGVPKPGGTPLLLYFAGHGTRDEKNERNTRYDLWDGDELTVRDLAEELARLPRDQPVVLVMAQCFSGAFADVLFRGGDPKGALADRPLAGFFSARKDREAAGCSYATDRADYQDFSSYFFGALCGRDRFGGAVAGADYDGDGSVSLHEAFCYALIHDRSADTPVCTTQAFLQRFAPLPNAAVYGTPYAEAQQAATPAQRAVLDALSAQLGLDGEARAVAAFDRLTYGDPAARASLLGGQDEARSRLGEVRGKFLGGLFARWPTLRWDDDREGETYQKAFDEAVEALTGDGEQRRALLAAATAHEQADEAVDDEEAALVRFASVYEQIVEARQLREHGKGEVKAQFERLWKAEQGTLVLTAK